MPHLKAPKLTEPLWKQNDEKANKKGLHHTVYQPDSKDEYTGDWFANLKEGKGTYTWKKSKTMYDGDWKTDKRHGFGTLSIKQKDGSSRKIYTGGWKDDKKHGYGTNYYENDEMYEGEWYANQRCGWGRMYYNDGSVYEGKWATDERNGEGMLRLANGNRFEGSFKDDKKNGQGKFFYLDKGQIFIGTWLNDIPKCGEMSDFGREQATDPTQFPIPEVTLENPKNVIDTATEEFISQIPKK